MNVYGTIIPVKPFTNFLLDYNAKKLIIRHYREKCILDTLPRRIRQKKCGLVNLDSVKGP